MQIANCPKCGKVFTKMSNPVCDKCTKEENEQFERIRVFLEENPTSTVSEICDAIPGVTPKKIMKLVRDGRLEPIISLEGLITCEKCGRAIKSGRYCDKCVIAINQEAQELFASRVYTGPVMHTASDRKLKR